MTMAATFCDRRVRFLHPLRLKDAQLVITQKALRHGAVTASELTGRRGAPIRAVRASVRSPLWSTTLATVYFTAEREACRWAEDLVTRLPRIEHPQLGAQSKV
jgi:hypothetical protein